MAFCLRRARWLIVGLVAAACFSPLNPPSGHGASRPSLSEGAQKHLLSFIAEPLPNHAAVQRAPSFYSPDSLYDFMDGGADIYLLYDFQVLLHQDFKSGPADVSVDIFDMGSPEDAFGMYAAERSPNYRFLPIGIEAYRSQGVLNFLQDRYYVKLAGSGTGSDDLLDRFARLLSTRIAGVRSFPSLLEKLPQEHRVRHAEQFSRKDPLGHSFLSPAYIVSYKQGAAESKIVVSVAKDPAEANARREALAKYFSETGKCEAVPSFGAGALKASNSFEGSVIAVARGRYLIVLVHPSSDAAALLDQTARVLR